MDIREELERLADKEYKEFHSALLPTVDRDRIIGVRLPQLRAIAARIKEQARRALCPSSRRAIRSRRRWCAALSSRERICRLRST